jgi:hypothetical protein
MNVEDMARLGLNDSRVRLPRWAGGAALQGRNEGLTAPGLLFMAYGPLGQLMADIMAAACVSKNLEVGRAGGRGAASG